MPTTPTYGWPYQSRADAPNGPTLGEGLALAIEATLSAQINGLKLGNAGRRRVLAATNSFSNQATYAVFPQAGDRAALTVSSFVKAQTGTRLLLSISGSCQLSSGITQGLMLGLRIGGTDYDLARYKFPVAISRAPLVGFNEVAPGLAAGTYTIEPVFRADGASAVDFVSVDDTISYTVSEEW